MGRQLLLSRLTATLTSSGLTAHAYKGNLDITFDYLHGEGYCLIKLIFLNPF